MKKALVGVLLLGLAACSQPASNKPGSGTSGHPAAADLKISSCSVDTTVGVPQATVTITNHSAGTSDYTFQVDWLNIHKVVMAQGAGIESNIAAHQSAVSTVEGDSPIVEPVPMTCTIANVQRYASS